MSQELEDLRKNIDSWIKQMMIEIDKLNCLAEVINENTANIQHNYELIYGIKDDIRELKEELNAIKIMQITQLKKENATH